MSWKYFTHEPVGNNEWLAPVEPDNCPCGIDDGVVPLFVRDKGFLPSECLSCYKPLVFWRSDSRTSARFKKLLSSLLVGVVGKYNEELVVLYTDSREKVEKLEDVLTTKLSEFGIDGRFQWRVSCKRWQIMWPEFFVSAKEFSSKAYPKIKPWLTVDKWLDEE